MIPSYPPAEEKPDDIVEGLIRLPIRNLESRISELEHEIGLREHLSEELLLEFGTNRLRLEDRKYRLRYVGLVSVGSKEKQHVEKELQQLDKNESSEKIGCFRDVSTLRQRLQEAREALETNKEKARLVERL